MTRKLRKWTNERFDEEFLAPGKKYDGHVRVGNVTTRTARVEMMCADGHHYHMAPVEASLQTNKCATCRREWHRNFHGVDFHVSLLKSGYFPLWKTDDYFNKQTVLPAECPNGNKWRVSYAHWSNKTNPARCPCIKCKTSRGETININRTRRTPEQACEDLSSKGFKIRVSEYKTTDTPVTGTWISCGHKEMRRPYDIIKSKNPRCKRCSGRAKDTDMFAKELYEKTGYRLEPEAVYVNKRTKIGIICNIGHRYLARPDNVLNHGNLCPQCRAESIKGENNPSYNTAWPKEKILSEIKRMSDEGERVNSVAVQKSRPSLYRTACSRFGHWGTAYELATGDDYQKINGRGGNPTDALYGMKFEKLMRDLLSDTGISFEYNLVQAHKCRPDFSLGKYHWVDAKLADTTLYGRDTQSKYEPHVRRLDIVYLINRSNKPAVYEESEKTRQIDVMYLLNFLDDGNRKKYERAINELKREYEREKNEEVT